MDLKEQYFGTEIEMTGITREEAANAVGELFGTQPYYIGTYYVGRRIEGDANNRLFF